MPFHSTNHICKLPPQWFVWFHNVLKASECPFIQQMTYVSFDLSGSYGFTTHFRHLNEFGDKINLELLDLELILKCSYVSSNDEDGSPIHCIHFKPTNKEPLKSIKDLQVHPIAQVPSSSNARRVPFDYSDKCNYLLDNTNYSGPLQLLRFVQTLIQPWTGSNPVWTGSKYNIKKIPPQQ